jgi:hypothetical protein
LCSRKFAPKPRFKNALRGQCYEHIVPPIFGGKIFRRKIFGEKIAVFLKTNVAIQILQKIAIFWGTKNGENIFKNPTNIGPSFYNTRKTNGCKVSA